MELLDILKERLAELRLTNNIDEDKCDTPIDDHVDRQEDAEDSSEESSDGEQ